MISGGIQAYHLDRVHFNETLQWDGFNASLGFYVDI